MTITAPFTIDRWPRHNRGKRGRKPEFSQFFDGKIHVIPFPRTGRYKHMHSFRQALTGAANHAGFSIETCTDYETYPDCLIVRVLGPLESDSAEVSS